MIASKSIRRIWILGFKIVVCIIVGVIASNALAAQATLAWDPNTESDLAGYRIHYGTASGSYSVHTDVHNVTTYTVTGLTAGQTYYFVLSAYDSSGNESGYSNQVGYSITASNVPPSAPGIPSGPATALVNASAIFSTSASDPNGDSLQYRYDWGGGVLSSWGPASQSHSWAVAGQYAVKVQAHDSVGAESAWSSAKTITITQGTVPVVIDTDGDGVPDSQDAFPNDPKEWADVNGNGIGDNAEGTVPVVMDTDGDGVPDSQDAFPNDPKEWADANRNGIGDNADAAAGQGNLAPDAPLLTAPVKDSVVSTMAEMQTGPFNSSVAGTTHAQTRWQVFRDEDDACLLDIQSATALTSFTVPKLVLDEGTPFFWRAQFIDSNGAASGWSVYDYFSTQTTETDLNANGIPDAQEVPSTADLNRDGVPDSQQTVIKSVKMEGTTAQTGVSIMETPAALAIESVESEDPRQPDLYPNNKPQNMPFGILNIKIAVANPGDQAVVKLYFLEPVPAAAKWYEYDTAADRWIDFSAYTEFANDRMSATLTLRDGGPGDSDGVANGVIIDPGGIGVADNAYTNGSASQSGSGGGAGCFIGAVNDSGRYESMIIALCLLGSLSLLRPLRIKKIRVFFLGLGRE